MRIVDRATFLALPAGTIFAKFGDDKGTEGHFYFSEIRIKSSRRGETDWYDVGFTDGFTSASDSGEWANELQRAVETGAELEIDFETITADGLFDDGQLFAVLSDADVTRLIARLFQARIDAKMGATE